MRKNIIEVKDITKSFTISAKTPGIKGTLRHFFNRKTSAKLIEVTFKSTNNAG